MFAKNCWYVAAWASDLADQPLACRVAGESIALYRDTSGRPVGLADRCCHRLAPLSRGRIEGDELRCMYHGLRFDARGRCTEVPGQDSIPEKFRVASYHVAERHGWIWVWLGDAGKADPALIPASELDQPKWRCRTGQLDWAVDYRLLNDNLCDFSHLTYVHATSFGLIGQEVWARSKPRVADIDRGVRIERWIVGIPLPPYLGLEGLCDIWSTYDYLVPGVLLLASAIYRDGTAQASAGQKPAADAEPIQAGYSAQAATPLDETHTRYFFGVGVRSIEPPERLDIYHGMTMAAFAEDHAMLEAQQRNIALCPGVEMGVTGHDRGTMRIRKLIADMAGA